MNQGKIIESGSHLELLRSKGCYAHLYNTRAEACQKTHSPNITGIMKPRSIVYKKE